MELTQSDYDERVARQAAGNGTDEDLRLIKHYEDQGFSTREDSAGKREQSRDDQDGTDVIRSETGSGADVKPIKSARGPARP